MKYVILVLFIAAAPFAHADTPPGWSTDYGATLTAAQSAHEPIMLYFSATWCGPCKLMTRTTLSDPTLRPALAGIAHVSVDMDQNPDLAEKYGVNVVPTFIMLTPDGDEVERVSGYQSAPDFLQWLASTTATARQLTLQMEVARKALVEIDQSLASKSTASMRQAAVMLYNLCDARDNSITKQANDRLKTIATAGPAILLDGLDDSRLATRIAVANTIQSTLGDNFDIDPWSDAATREAKVRAWYDKLTKTTPAVPKF